MIFTSAKANFHSLRGGQYNKPGVGSLIKSFFIANTDNIPGLGANDKKLVGLRLLSRSLQQLRVL